MVYILNQDIMCFFRPFVTDRSDYNAKDISVIDAPERSR